MTIHEQAIEMAQPTARERELMLRLEQAEATLALARREMQILRGRLALEERMRGQGMGRL